MPLYRARVAAGEINPDPAQRLAVEKLQLLHMRLATTTPRRPKRIGLGRFGWGRDRLEERVVPGLYLYGGVGRGKSMLMDLFYQAAAIAPRRRVHFHAFMQEVHEGIHAARGRRRRGSGAPVADAMADGATLLCFDEVQVTDITDAMLVGRLFQRLFERGVVIVATSNRHPDELYKNGLNRHLFLPFIALIKERLEIHELEGPTDHRQGRAAGERDLRHAAGAFGAGGARRRVGAADRGRGGYAADAGGAGARGDGAAAHAGAARASFAELCSMPLGPADYLAITAAFQTWSSTTSPCSRLGARTRPSGS